MKMKKFTKILLIVCVLGLSLLLYPTVSNYWNQRHATQAINNYQAMIKEMNTADARQLVEDAAAYNRDLFLTPGGFGLSEARRAVYDKALDITGTGIMGYIDIAKLGVSLPIYHGTSNDVLQIAIGHLDWSSLPVGGENTHCVVSGHRGLPNAKLFTDLDKLIEGDTFTINVLYLTLTYKVDQIRIVLPNEMDDLAIAAGEDYCTLVTCTPYGINSHRLLVRGHRVDNAASALQVISEGIIVDPLIVAPVVAFPLLLALVMIVLFRKPKKKIKPEDLINKKEGAE